MNHRIIALSTTYHVLIDVLALLRQVSAQHAVPNWEQLSDRILQKTNEVSLEMIGVEPTSPAELSHKASVVLDWLNEQEPDAANALAVSLCRDVLRMFPAADN